jgi:hypothetical protein
MTLTAEADDGSAQTAERRPARGASHKREAIEKAESLTGIKVRKSPGRQNTLLSLAGLDRRTVAYRDTQRLVSMIEADLGGADLLSAAERQLVQHGAVLGALLTAMERKWISNEAPFDPLVFSTLVNAQRRLFADLGLRRVPRDVTPSLSAYLEPAS